MCAVLGILRQILGENGVRDVVYKDFHKSKSCADNLFSNGAKQIKITVTRTTGLFVSTSQK